MTNRDEAVDAALLRRLREAICAEPAANVDADGHLEAVLRLLPYRPDASEPPEAQPGDV